jgi:uncharacterized protein (TIGR03000 family)
MYSIVLMMVIGTGGQATAWGEGGCCGCTGQVVLSSGCEGGCGGGLLARLQERFHGCSGCYGCSGGHFVNSGCCGGVNSGCCGGAVTSGCNGCTGGTGGTVATPASTLAAQASPNAATIVVHLPEAAGLFIDGRVTSAASAERTFTTPALEEGTSNVYTLKAAIVRNGEVFVETATVTVHAGKETQVTMDCFVPLTTKVPDVLPASAVSAK